MTDIVNLAPSGPLIPRDKPNSALAEAIGHYDNEDVFISHHNTPQDNAVADALAAALVRHGINVWYDQQSLHAGSAYRGEIMRALHTSRIVVVLFPDNPSDWVVYEAACAHSDHKLLPVMLCDEDPPAPFANLHAERIPPMQNEPAFTAAIEMIADRCYRMIRGDPHAHWLDQIYLQACRWLNRQFRSGVTLFYLAMASVLTALIDITNENNLYESLHQAHLLLGMVVLGGLVFIPFGFAHALAARSYRHRQFGYTICERLFWVWFVVMIIQPFVGLGMTWEDDVGDTPGLEWHTPWIAMSLMVYLMAMITALLGYFQARLAIVADDKQNGRSFIVHRARSLGLFFVSFMLTVGIVSLMLFTDRLV